jgi:hypothetical protein
MTYFTKLDIDMSNLDLGQMNSGEVLHNPRGLDFTYYKVKEGYDALLLQKLPEEYRDKVSVIVYVIAGGPATFYPHRDKAGKTGINYYITTGSGETSFYEPKVENPRFMVIDGEEFEGWYDYTDLNKVSSFQANEHDCYMLDISSIHDLKMPSTDKRHFIQFIFEDKL